MEDKNDVTVEPVNTKEGEMTMKTEANAPVSQNANPHFTEKFLDVSAIKKRDTLRTRETEDEANIEGLRVAYLENKIAEGRGEKPIHQIPMIVVWYDPRTMKYVLLGGYHRLEGARRAGLTKIKVRVFHGSEVDAFQIAIQDNNTHGLKLSPGDKKYTIEKTLLRFPDKPYREIARELRCAVSYVSTIANKLHKAGLSEGKRKRKEQDSSSKTISQSNEQSSANAEPEKSGDEIVVEIYDRIDNMLDGKSMKEGKAILGGLFKRYGRINRYIREQALRNSNAAIIVKDQLLEAT